MLRIDLLTLLCYTAYRDGDYVRKIVVILSLLIYIGELIFCISSIKEFGVIKNFAILWFFPFVVQIVCYALLLSKRFSNSKIVVFVTIFGFMLSLPFQLITLPEILYWNIPILISAVLSSIFLCVKKSS